MTLWNGDQERLREPEKQERSVERFIFAFGAMTIELRLQGSCGKPSRIVNLQDERQIYNLPLSSLSLVNAAQVFPYSRLRHKPWDGTHEQCERSSSHQVNFYNLVRIATAGTELCGNSGNVMRVPEGVCSPG